MVLDNLITITVVSSDCSRKITICENETVDKIIERSNPKFVNFVLYEGNILLPFYSFKFYGINNDSILYVLSFFKQVNEKPKINVKAKKMANLNYDRMMGYSLKTKTDLVLEISRKKDLQMLKYENLHENLYLFRKNHESNENTMNIATKTCCTNVNDGPSTEVLPLIF